MSDQMPTNLGPKPLFSYFTRTPHGVFWVAEFQEHWLAKMPADPATFFVAHSQHEIRTCIERWELGDEVQGCRRS